MSKQHVRYVLLFLVLVVDSNQFQIYGVTHSGVAKAGPGRARAQPKFVPLMCEWAQWLSVHAQPIPITWLYHWLHALILAVHSYPLLLFVWGIVGYNIDRCIIGNNAPHVRYCHVHYEAAKLQVVCLKKDLTYHRHSPCQLTNELQEAQ